MNRRLLKELKSLYIQQSTREILQNDYLIYHDETNINRVHAIIKGRHDSVYRHKFIRLDLIIPDDYPHSPPQVTFINHDSVRIHPNMYENGKCCATILNTWGDDKFEKWTSSMGIETILLTFHSFLDNHPYTYEPGGRDDPSYTVYVLHQSWTTCLLRYLEYENIEPFCEYIENYLLMNIEEIFSDLRTLQNTYPYGYYFSNCFEIDRYLIDYQRIIYRLENFYNYIEFNTTFDADAQQYTFVDMNHHCCICFDTTENANDYSILPCNHKFHTSCLNKHIQKNNNICPMCRMDLDTPQQQDPQNNTPQDTWIINPLTKRRIKVGGKTYKYLVDNGHLTPI
jgi:ubiquitin-protein ligase